MTDTTNNLTIRHLTDGICVEDAEGGTWWPNEYAAAEIEDALDPEAEAIRICTEEPMRGRWTQ